MSKTKINEMRALSIAQPWAECIVSFGKNIENRSWNTKMRGFFAIHASASKSKERFEVCFDEYRLRLRPTELDYGVIVGFAELVEVIKSKDVTRKTKKWFSGEFGFVLENVIRLEKPIEIKGSLGFWKLKGKMLNASIGQLSNRDLRKVESGKLLGSL